MNTLAEIGNTLNQRRAKTKPYRHLINRAAVAAVLREDAEHNIEVLFIKRASSEQDRWSGHIAFPGGRVDPQDESTRNAAMRETQEELALTLRDDDYLGRLSDVMTISHGKRSPMVVSPYVFKAEGDVTLTQNYEVADAFWVPLSFLVDKTNVSEMTWEKSGVPVKMPCINIKPDYCLWGLTYRMVRELTELI